MIPVVCAWCLKVLKGGPIKKGQKVSHGICPECEVKMEAEYGETK